MVHYINKPARWGLKTGLLIGGLTLTAFAAAHYFELLPYQVKPENAVSSETITVERSPNLDERLGTVLSELEGNQSEMDKHHQKLVALTVKGLRAHPDAANNLVRASLSAIDSADARIEPETYIPMFDEIRKKAEENPEIMDYFGPNATDYYEKKTLKKYMARLEGALKRGKRRLAESVQGLRENEKVKQIYDSTVEAILSLLRDSQTGKTQGDK